MPRHARAAAYLPLIGCTLFAADLPAPAGRITRAEPADWARIPLADSRCALVNNVWNKGASGGALVQEIFLEDIDGRPTPGWRWTSPPRFIPFVVSQPQIVCGDKPWEPPSGQRADFPFAAGTRRLDADFDISLRASGLYNMSFTLWAVSSLPPEKNTISHEIMIWNANHGQLPAGTPRGTIEVAGLTYSVHVRERHTDASGANANTWMYVAFVARKPVLGGRLPLGEFVSWLLSHRLITTSHYIASVELGNEVSHGAGVVELKRFSISVAPGP